MQFTEAGVDIAALAAKLQKRISELGDQRLKTTEESR
jgi:hypothetical protein